MNNGIIGSWMLWNGAIRLMMGWLMFFVYILAKIMIEDRKIA